MKKWWEFEFERVIPKKKKRGVQARLRGTDRLFRSITKFYQFMWNTLNICEKESLLQASVNQLCPNNRLNQEKVCHFGSHLLAIKQTNLENIP